MISLPQFNKNKKFISRDEFSKKLGFLPLEERIVLNASTSDAIVMDFSVTGPGGLSVSPIVEGAVTTVSAQIVDNNAAVTDAPNFNLLINWGDGSTPTKYASTIQSLGGTNGFEFVINATHAYSEEGSPNITFTVENSNGNVYNSPFNSFVDQNSNAYASDPFTYNITVIDPSVVGHSVSNLTFTPGQSQTSTVATFTDPGGAEALTDYSASINWGDSTSSPGSITVNNGTFTVMGTHTYSSASAGSDQITVTIFHDSSTSVNVIDSAIVKASPAIAVTESQTGSTENITATMSQAAPFSTSPETVEFAYFLNGAIFPSTFDNVTITSNGTATDSQSLAPGNWTVDVFYNGDANNNSAAPTLAFTVLHPSTLTLSETAVGIDGLTSTATLSAGQLSSPSEQISFSYFIVFPGFASLGTNSDTISNNGTATDAVSSSNELIPGYIYQVVANYGGDTNNTPASATTTLAYGIIVTTPQPSSPALGSALTDTATIIGNGITPTGTVTFNLYNNFNGTGTALFTDTETLANGTATTLHSYTATAAGTDYWFVTYNGDSNYMPATSNTATVPTAQADIEAVTIPQATPMIATSQNPASATVGASIADQATISGGYSPTGTVTFNLYSNSTGTGTPLFTDNNEPLVNGTATSASFTTTATGTDYWVATYNGDSNNSTVTSGTSAESVTITTATPAINTSQQPASATVGGSIADQATVSGGYNPTGSVTFNLYNNSNGTGTPLFTDTETLSGGMATSKGYATAATGTDYWVATFNGDTNNNAVTSGTALEPVTINPVTPILQFSESSPINEGDKDIVNATITGGYNLTGTLTFHTSFTNDVVPIVAGQSSYSDTIIIPEEGKWLITVTYTPASTDLNNTTTSGTESVTVFEPQIAANPASLAPTQVGAQSSSETVATFTHASGVEPTGDFTATINWGIANHTADPGTITRNPDGSYNVTATPPTFAQTGIYSPVVTISDETMTTTVTESLLITQATPTITTTLPATAPIGSQFADVAKVGGLVDPTGNNETVTFNLYNVLPNYGATIPISIQTVSLTGGTATSNNFNANITPVGSTDYFIAVYNGDANNKSVISAVESITITKASPTITTTQEPATAKAGTSIADLATITGGYNPSGTITFNLYNNSTGTGTALFTDTETLSGGSATSKGYTATTAGTDYWVATYNGDSNNIGITSGKASEPVVITKSSALWGLDANGDLFSIGNVNNAAATTTNFGHVYLNLSFLNFNVSVPLANLDGFSINSSGNAYMVINNAFYGFPVFGTSTSLVFEVNLNTVTSGHQVNATFVGYAVDGGVLDTREIESIAFNHHATGADQNYLYALIQEGGTSVSEQLAYLDLSAISNYQIPIRLLGPLTGSGVTMTSDQGQALTFNPTTGQLYVSDMKTDKIYAVAMNGAIGAVYDNESLGIGNNPDITAMAWDAQTNSIVAFNDTNNTLDNLTTSSNTVLASMSQSTSLSVLDDVVGLDFF